jgi:hypothetical protein
MQFNECMPIWSDTNVLRWIIIHGPELIKSCENPVTGIGMDVKVKVQTDNYPYETAWTIINPCGTGFAINSPP